MNIDLSKLENCRQSDKKIIARCPACSEMGQDKTGNHLIINEDGRFGCVVYQGDYGRDHRKRILHLIGEKLWKNTSITLRKTSQVSQNKETIIIKNVLGQLGRDFQTSFEKYPSQGGEAYEDLVQLYGDIVIQKKHKDCDREKKAFSSLWNQLENRARTKIVDILCERNLLPMIIKQTRDVFNGNIISLL
ncbi:MAG: hypothetical protein P9M03_05025 [Candidatus Theseobacter exili]|nr:hypothetical protein [Candidatus Theseobacter exili]